MNESKKKDCKQFLIIVDYWPGIVTTSQQGKMTDRFKYLDRLVPDPPGGLSKGTL